MNHSLHLKRYVETHPDNKMAWYLLGKEYERAGEQGKANYCYNRAEEVYEAFERSQVPSDIWKSYEMRLLQMEKERERKRLRKRWLLAALIMLLLVFIPPVQAPGAMATRPFDWGFVTDSNPATAAVQGLEDQNKNGSNPPLFTALASKQDKNDAGVLPSLLQHSEQLPSWSVALGMQRSGKWLLWSEDLERLYGLWRDEQGTIAIRPFEGAAAECNCEPVSSSGLKQSAGAWAKLQLETAVLQQAVSGYRERHGKLPESFDVLTRPFPENWLSGRSETMAGMFEALMKRQSQKGSSGRPSLPGGLDEGMHWGTLPDGAPFFKEPLRVVIDRKHHRLAVVSGNIMLRNYPVGLGGNKTPLGSFHISDKVVHPNGTSRGPYGTRGMQLSDSLYAIHGTEDLGSIGANESEGCIRMLKQDVEELFDLVPMGTAVVIGEGVLPDDLWTPHERFKLKHTKGQTNPNTVYHWLY
ncbi:hypothetical protein JCM10914A_03790 [Paenibacillus sp. JCM 10914]|uniref:L,D-transpeptidase n=1 Tax=Paenibacillus sp. JCM 10914 TaxID=1236974 RepID=UPI0003CC27A3|nr:L,D-transpeptidase [Paenibacillus sp. JCM 10914]GAE07943.1 hypothetical protein JCM10914_4192 [Paenibacillus sp. JCM 10914]